VIVACAGEIYPRRDATCHTFDDYFEKACDVLDIRPENADHSAPQDRPPPKDPSAEADHLYARLQASVPARAPLFTMLEEPFRLDFHRNNVAILDLPGVVSPGVGLPLFKGPDALAAYLGSLGFRYLAFVDTRSTQGLYKRQDWAESADSRGEMIQSFAAPAILDLFSDIDQLADSRRHLFDESHMVVLDLAGRR
jgi:hypothetical protein